MNAMTMMAHALTGGAPIVLPETPRTVVRAGKAKRPPKLAELPRKIVRDGRRKYDTGAGLRVLAALGTDPLTTAELAQRLGTVDQKRVSMTLWNLRRRGAVAFNGKYWSQSVDPDQPWTAERVNAFLARALQWPAPGTVEVGA